MDVHNKLDGGFPEELKISIKQTGLIHSFYENDDNKETKENEEKVKICKASIIRLI